MKRIAVLVLIAAAGCATAPPPAPASTATPTPSPVATPAPVVKAEAITRSGTGRIGIGESFTLTAGLHKFTASHSGEHNFIVDLKDAKGVMVAGLFNEIGKVEGKVYSTFVAKTGMYYLDTMAADGVWTIKVE